MCISILHTRNEILLNDIEHHNKRLHLFQKVIYFIDYEYGGCISIRRLKQFFISFYSLYDHIVNFGCRYGFYESKEKITSKTFRERHESWKKEVIYSIFRPMTFWTIDYLLYENSRKHFWRDIKEGLLGILLFPRKILRKRIRNFIETDAYVLKVVTESRNAEIMNRLLMKHLNLVYNENTHELKPKEIIGVLNNRTTKLKPQ